MGPTWVLSTPEGPHVGPMNLAIRGDCYHVTPVCRLKTSRGDKTVSEVIPSNIEGITTSGKIVLRDVQPDHQIYVCCPLLTHWPLGDLDAILKLQFSICIFYWYLHIVYG